MIFRCIVTHGNTVTHIFEYCAKDLHDAMKYLTKEFKKNCVMPSDTTTFSITSRKIDVDNIQL